MANKGSEIQIGDGSLQVGDRVVYPNQGICKITGVEVKQIAGQSWEMVTLSREEDGATVMVPKSKVTGIGLRKVATVDAIDEVFDYLASPSDDPQLDWKVRHRENADKMTGGGLFGTAEVLKGLHALSRVRPLPQKERELYDSARHLLVGEIAAATNIPVMVAEDNLDYALFPPPGMKRKGKELQLAAIPATGGTLRTARGAEDDLGFDDETEDAEETEAAGTGAPAAEADEEGEEETAAKPAKEAKAAKAVKGGAKAPAKIEAKHEPKRDHAQDAGHAHSHEHRAEPKGAHREAPAEKHAAKAEKAAEKHPHKAETPAGKHSARHPAKEKPGAKPASVKPAAARKAAAPTKAAAKKPAPAKKAAPAAKTKAKGKR